MANQEKELRIASIEDFKIEMREEDKENKMIIEGYAAVFNRETLIGSEDWGFYESIDPKAFDNANMRDVPLKYNHSDNIPILARTRNNSLQLRVDDVGLFYECELPNTRDARDVFNLVEKNIVDGNSFGFFTNDEIVDGVHTLTETNDY